MKNYGEKISDDPKHKDLRKSELNRGILMGKPLAKIALHTVGLICKTIPDSLMK
jgi:hypothetical protein